jgi:ribosomal protein L32
MAHTPQRLLDVPTAASLRRYACADCRKIADVTVCEKTGEPHRTSQVPAYITDAAGRKLVPTRRARRREVAQELARQRRKAHG